jgi:hypothetical protein
MEVTDVDKPMRLVAGLLALSWSVVANAQDDDEIVYPPDESVASERCVSLTRLGRTEVIDDRNVLFHMRGNRIFRNVLPRRCRGLFREQAFSYRTAATRLCEKDLITVITRAGPGNMAGPTCALGKFYPVTEPEADAIREEAQRIRELDLEDLE